MLITTIIHTIVNPTNNHLSHNLFRATIGFDAAIAYTNADTVNAS